MSKEPRPLPCEGYTSAAMRCMDEAAKMFYESLEQEVCKQSESNGRAIATPEDVQAAFKLARAPELLARVEELTALCDGKETRLLAAARRIAELEQGRDGLAELLEKAATKLSIVTADNARLRELLSECHKHLPQFSQLGIDVLAAIEKGE